MNALTRAYIALGSNLDDPIEHINNALHDISTIPKTKHIKTSKFYRSHPLGEQEQPDYVNVVAAYETELSAHELLDHLQRIEQAHGRTRSTKRWGPRTLDLDLVLFGEQMINTTRLIVPHPGLCKRNFVLYPLADLDPLLVLPNGKTLASLLAGVGMEGLEIL